MAILPTISIMVILVLAGIGEDPNPFQSYRVMVFIRGSLKLCKGIKESHKKFFYVLFNMSAL